MQISEGGPNPTRVVGRRVAAYLLNGVFGTLILGAILALFDPDWYRQTDPETGALATDVQLTASALQLLWFIINGAILEGLFGWSLGKLLLQLRVVRWDGRPPGPLRGLVRNLMFIVDLFPYCFPIVGLGTAVSRSDHRRVGDMVADTYVVDAPYFGHLIVRTPDGVHAGPKSVKPEDLAAEGVAGAMILRPKQPVFEKSLDTYIVWNEQQQRLLKFDKASETWVPID
jgi:uncharacterized RDD family membrane protein YckC